MFWLRPRLPLSEDEANWIEAGYQRLFQAFGEEFFKARQLILPTEEYFPDRFDSTEEAVNVLGRRIAGFIGLNPDNLIVRLFIDESDRHSAAVGGAMQGQLRTKGAAGLYHHRKTANGKVKIQVKTSLLSNPSKLVATLAHELAHWLLLGKGGFSAQDGDHELLIDLATVFCGLGIFTANSAFDFKQHEGGGRFGWSTSRLGYLSESQFGYALARFAMLKCMGDSSWLKHLDCGVRTPCKQSLKYLLKNKEQTNPQHLDA